MKINKLFRQLFRKDKHKEEVRPYVEKYTKCDTCEYLEQCKENGMLIEVTNLGDNHMHYTKGMGQVCIPMPIPSK